MSEPDYFKTPADKIKADREQANQVADDLDELCERWVELEELSEQK